MYTCAKERCMFLLIMNTCSLMTLTRSSTALEMAVLTRPKRLASLSPLLLLTPGGYSRRYIHFSRPINVSRTGWLNGCSSVTPACWQERRLQHLIWSVSSFQDADVARGQGVQGLNRPEGFRKHIVCLKRETVYMSHGWSGANVSQWLWIV